MDDKLILQEEYIQVGMRIEEGGAEEKFQPRIKNMGKIQCEKITGFDRSEPMIVYGQRDATVNGTNTAGMPCSLIIFRWYLHQRERGKRFKSLCNSVTFATERKEGNRRALLAIGSIR